MRLRPEFAAGLLCLWLGLAAPALPAAEAFTQQEVREAIKTVRADPNLVSERTERRLDWGDDDDEDEKPGDWKKWLMDLFAWIAGISQMLMWLLVAALVAILGVVVLRLFKGSGPRLDLQRASAPTHVRDLDIRPESLPADIGAAARKLWESGEQRAALALLYRGLLSRLAHSYAVPIRDSSTEGDCLALAARTLDARRLDYIRRLIRTWQLAIYAGQKIDDGVIFEICADFAAHLPQAGETEMPRGAPYARGAAT